MRIARDKRRSLELKLPSPRIVGDPETVAEYQLSQTPIALKMARGFWLQKRDRGIVFPIIHAR